jgi:hypothetical protein
MIVDKLTKQFSRASASTQYIDDLNKKEHEEGKPLHDDYKNEKLDEALAGCAGSSPGPDQIHYKFIKKMARTEKLQLLEVYEQIWKTGAFVKEWTEAILIHIQKSGKDTE